MDPPCAAECGSAGRCRARVMLPGAGADIAWVMRRPGADAGNRGGAVGISLARRVAALAAAGAILGGGGVFALGLIEHSAARDGVRGESAASAMLSAILDQDAALQSFAATESVAFTAKYSADTRAFQAAELAATESAKTPSEIGPLTRAIYDAQ